MFRQVLTTVAQAISILLYPLIMPTYGMLLFCWCMSQLGTLPVGAWIVCVGFTLLLTLIIPVTAIMIRIRSGKVSDLYITLREQRTVPYLYTITCFTAWCYMLWAILHAPMYLVLIAVAATLALVAVLIINRWWKISAHLTGLGGLTGGVLGHYLIAGGGAMLLPLLLLGAALVLMYARLYLKAHSQLQVIFGYLLGLTFTFIPCMILSYAA